MTPRESYSACQESEFTIINQGFVNKLEKIKKYILSQVAQDPDYILLLDNLESLMVETNNCQIKITIVGRQEKLIEKVKIANQASDLLNYFTQHTTIIFPYNLDRLLTNCDLILLVIDSKKNSIIPEQKLVTKAQEKNIPLIILDFNQCYPNIKSWLQNTSDLTINYFNFTHKRDETTQSSLAILKYHNVVKPLLTKTILRIEATLEKKLLKIVNKYFIQRKSAYWQENNQQKQNYFLGENPSQIQKRIKKLPHNINKIWQNKFKTIKQTFQESKQELVNPFVSTSFIYNVQQIIRHSTVIQYRENKKICLNLMVTKEQYRQEIHSHILELYQQKIDLWIQQQWEFLDQELNLFNQLIEKSDRELKILQKLSESALKLPSIPQPVFDLSQYICPTALSDINRVIFDYHYTQSSWFRITIAIALGLIFFLLTDRLYGFIFLIIQILNLLTGQSYKALKLKQQTKELKKSVDTRYQNMVKFIADKLIQDINLFLDQQSQLYQEKINLHIQESDKNFSEIKQKIIDNKNRIAQLNKDQENLRQIINSELNNEIMAVGANSHSPLKD